MTKTKDQDIELEPKDDDEPKGDEPKDEPKDDEPKDDDEPKGDEPKDDPKDDEPKDEPKDKDPEDLAGWKRHAKRWETRATDNLEEIKGLKLKLEKYETEAAVNSSLKKYELPDTAKALLEGLPKDLVEAKAKALQQVLQGVTSGKSGGKKNAIDLPDNENDNGDKLSNEERLKALGL